MADRSASVCIVNNTSIPLYLRQAKVDFEQEYFYLRHVQSGLFVHPRGGKATFDNQELVLHSPAVGETRLLFTYDDGCLKHVESGMFVHPRGGSAAKNDTPLVLFNSSPEPRLELELVDGCLRNKQTGYYVHPEGGVGRLDAKLVYFNSGPEPRLWFELVKYSREQHLQRGKQRDQDRKDKLQRQQQQQQQQQQQRAQQEREEGIQRQRLLQEEREKEKEKEREKAKGGYKFGDFTKGLLKSVSAATGGGKSGGGDKDGYKFGDITKGMVNKVSSAFGADKPFSSSQSSNSNISDSGDSITVADVLEGPFTDNTDFEFPTQRDAAQFTVLGTLSDKNSQSILLPNPRRELRNLCCVLLLYRIRSSVIVM